MSFEIRINGSCDLSETAYLSADGNAVATFVAGAIPSGTLIEFVELWCAGKCRERREPTQGPMVASDDFSFTFRIPVRWGRRARHVPQTRPLVIRAATPAGASGVLGAIDEESFAGLEHNDLISLTLIFGEIATRAYDLDGDVHRLIQVRKAEENGGCFVRRASGGHVLHLVPFTDEAAAELGRNVALCGFKPSGRRGRWCSPSDRPASCQGCLKAREGEQ